MTDATKQSALSLLERLRTLAETWEHPEPPGLYHVAGQLSARLPMAEKPEFHRAYAALAAVHYYLAGDLADAKERLNKAIEALRGTTP